MTKGKIAQSSPVAIDVEAGKNYFWCTCGLSSRQPFCDGSHKDTEFKPMKWTAQEDGKKFFCACKQTENAPFCDGAHKKL
jgi:CDGSH-type Zn-finger protein